MVRINVPVKSFYGYLMTIGKRLKEERERIGLTQTALGAVGGVRKQAQLKYEADDSYPTAQYLVEVSKVGIDIQYVVIGIRAETTINNDERELIKAYRSASPQVRVFMLQGISGGSAPQVHIAGSVGEQVNIQGDGTKISYKKGGKKNDSKDQ